MPNQPKTDLTDTDTVKEQRMKVLDEIEELIHNISEETGRPLDHIKTNINIAEEELLNDGEFNYSVRFALHQLQQAVSNSQPEQEKKLGRIEEYRTNLAEKAELPPQHQLER